MTSVHSSQLQFTRDGRTLVVAEHDGVRLVERAGPDRRWIAISEVQSIAAFTDQVWVATCKGMLQRLGADGRQLDEHPLPVDPDAALYPTTIGAPSALWTACDAVMLFEDMDRFACTAAQASAAIPIAGRRLAHYAGPRLTLPAGTAMTLANGAQIAGGCVILEGTSLALVAEHPHGRSIVVVALASGRALQSVAVPQGKVRIAARRGVAVVQDTARHLVLVDLKFGRQVGAMVTADDVTDVAIDPDGQLLALRLASGELEFAPLRRGGATQLPLAQAASAAAAAEVPAAVGVADGPPPVPDEALPAESSTSAPRPVEGLISALVEALEPRLPRARLSREQAQVELDRELRSVTLWAARAISQAWDARRLAYGNEGDHPYEHEVAGLVGSGLGFARDHVAAANAALAKHEALLAGDPGHRSASTPMAELREEFGLSTTAIDVLLAIAAPSLRGAVARLYGILGNDPGRAMVDELLVESVLADRVSGEAIAGELEAGMPLVRLGIVDIKKAGRPRPFAALEVDAVVLSRLRGAPIDLGVASTVHVADRELAALELAPGVLMSAVAAASRAQRPARIAIRGRTGSGRRTLLAAFAHKAGRALGVIDASQLPRDTERFVSALQVALRRCQLAGLVPVVRELDAVVFGERTGTDLARETLAAHPGPLAVLTAPEVSPPLRLGHVVIDLLPLSETERLAVWERALEGSGQWLRDAAGLAARYRVGPGVIRRAIAAATAMGGADPTAPCDDAIDAFLRQSRDVRLSDHARRVERLARWADLVLPPDVMDSLREFVSRVRHRRKVFEDWGMTGTMATSRGLTALFQGQPGTGKTLVAGVIARELGLDLYHLRCGPGRSGDPLVRRGRLAVCQADRGPLEQRPLRQSRGQLPAAAARCVRGHRDADHQQRRLDRSGVQAPAVVSAVVPVPR